MMKAFEKELAKFTTGKGSIQFPQARRQLDATLCGCVEMSAEPRPFDCECIVCSGFGLLITKEK